MIVEAVLGAIFAIIRGVAGLFPQFPEIDTSGLSELFNVLGMIDMFVDLSVLSTCLVAMFVIMNAEIIWKAIMWVVRKIPGVN